MSLEAFKDSVAQAAYGMTRDEALSRGICISCHESVGPTNIYSRAGAAEYRISGLCERCFDAMFDDEGR